MVLWALRFGCFAIVVFCVLHSLALAAPPDAPPARDGDAAVRSDQVARATTAALLDFDRLPLGALLEAQLTMIGGLDWLDRGEIEQVLREQKLQALFSPEGAAARATLGKLLKADLLVMLRQVSDDGPQNAAKPAEANAPRLQMVVTETRRGIRLLTQSIEASPDAKGTVALLSELVEQAIAKQRQQVREIYAVPPFVSHDLVFRYDYLKEAYAKLLESILLKRPGAVVVELSEAQALAQEIQLAEPEGNVQRTLPLYLLGEYRNMGSADEPRITFRIKLMRGTTELAQDSRRTLLPDQVASEIAKVAQALLAATSGAANIPIEAGAEAAQLAARGRAFERLSNWSEALNLYEAALLLDPAQFEARSHAIFMCTMLAPPTTYVELANMLLMRRGLLHWERLLASATKQVPIISEEAYRDFKRTMTRHITSETPKGLTPEIREERAAQRRILQSIVRRAAVLQGNLKYEDEGEVDSFYATWLSTAIGHNDVQSSNPDASRERREAYDRLLQAILELQDLPHPAARAKDVIWGPYSVTDYSLAKDRERLEQLFVENPNKQLGSSFSQEFVDFADRLVAQSSPALREYATDLKRTTAIRVQAASEAREKGAKRFVKKQRIDHVPADHLHGEHFRPVEFTWIGEEGEVLKQQHVNLCFPLMPGVDLVWSGLRMFLMKERGTLKSIWKGPDTYFSSPFRDYDFNGHGAPAVCFDGRYAWVVFSSQKSDPRLIIVDPVSERTWEVTPKDGLPVIPREEVPKGSRAQSLAPTALAPGKVCIAGSFGRTWIATVTFDPENGAKVDVFFEAREYVDLTDPLHWQKANLAFCPTFILTLTDRAPAESTANPRVLLGRSFRGSLPMMTHPLVIDPQQRSVTVLESELPFMHTDWDTSQGALYMWDLVYGKPGFHGMRLGFPSLKPELVMPGLPPGKQMVIGDEVHVFGEHWWVRKFGESRVRVREKLLPWYFDSQMTEPVPGVDRWNQGRTKEEALVYSPKIFRSHHYGLLVTGQVSLVKVPPGMLQFDLPAASPASALSR